MKKLILLILLSSTFTVKAQTAKQDSAHHRQYHLMRKDPKQNNPYTFADSAKVKSLPIVTCGLCVFLTTGTIKERHFLVKTHNDTVNGVITAHIKLHSLINDSNSVVSLNDDREIIIKYSKAEQIKILEEYLSFEGDTTQSNKAYPFKPGVGNTRPKGTDRFTIEIEALFSFTWLLTYGYPSIRPILIDRKTGEQLNGSPQKVAEVFNVYKRWLSRNKKRNFRNSGLPLDGFKYGWLGDSNARIFTRAF
ncbi:hypothetical protein [Pararcticibacter amylolyticus]|nr:hypothetical protein [Pararcticibacter amylolyticus]